MNEEEKGEKSGRGKLVVGVWLEKGDSPLSYALFDALERLRGDPAPSNVSMEVDPRFPSPPP